jgi:Uma2 family endonuclease
VQNAVQIRDFTPMSRPRPDIALLKPLPELFGAFEPTADDVLLLVEVSDSSIRYDRKTKAPLYAEAAIPEYWILNIAKGVLEVRSEPADGEYRRTEILKPGQTVSPKMLPGVAFAVDDILK